MFTLPHPGACRDPRRRRTAAFTLIELIVVVIIIAVLAAIAGVAYNQFVGNARDTAVLADAKQVDTALTARSAADDQTPAEIVAANASALLDYRVSAESRVTATPKPDATNPTALEVSDGTRFACLTLGTSPGAAGTITLGPCGAGSTPTPAPTPTPTPDPTPAEVVWASTDAGEAHTCGVKIDGTGWCWGAGASGRLGNGAKSGSRPTPVALGGAWTVLTSGAFHTCGVKTDQTAWCWGYGLNGRLGNGSTADQATPSAVSGGGTWTALSAGQYHTCGVKTDGTAWCWGYSASGQLGNGATDSQKTPFAVAETTP